MPKASDVKKDKQDTGANAKYLKTSDDTVLEGHITIIGPFGHGKTTLLASASEAFPIELPAKTRTTLHDILFVQFDRGGTASLAPMKLFAPHIIDARMIIADKGITEGQKVLMDLINEKLVEYPEITNVGLDTVTRWDLALVAHFSKVHANNSNTYQKWGDVYDRHARLYTAFDSKNIRLISTFHTKARPEPQNTQQQNAQNAQSLASLDSDIVHAISGQARSLYLGDASLKLALYTSVNKRDGTVRTAFPFGGKEMEGGCRYYDWLDEEEPANLQLIFDKIKRRLRGGEPVEVPSKKTTGKFTKKK